MANQHTLVQNQIFGFEKSKTRSWFQFQIWHNYMHTVSAFNYCSWMAGSAGYLDSKLL